MSIIRSARKERDFSILSNIVLQDPNLSMRGLGLLVRLLSRPDNWETNSELLAREFDCGREQMRAVLGELRDLGYMKLVKSQDAKGHWSSQWFVLEEPEQKDLSPPLPKLGQPEPGNRVLGEPDAITKTDYKEPIPKKPRAALADPVLFDAFWKAYPKKVGKDAAKKAFDKRKPDGKLLDDMLRAVAQQKQTPGWIKDDGQFVPNPATWLNQGRWMDGEGAGGQAPEGGIAAFPGAI